MTDLRKAAEIVIEVHDENYGELAHNISISELRQALAMERFSEVSQEIEEAMKQPKREWVGLTDEEAADLWADAHDIDGKMIWTPAQLFEEIERRLKEKNDA